MRSLFILVSPREIRPPNSVVLVTLPFTQLSTILARNPLASC